MSVKQELRKHLKKERANIVNKELLSKEIIKKVTSSTLYKSAEAVLCYSSLKDEVDTKYLMKLIHDDGKKLALPRCIKSDGQMNFYVVDDLENQLENGSYNVLEPNIDICKEINSFDNSIIIVPGLSFDHKGYRLGYGKGYYDRFLEKHSLISIGLCYNCLIKNELPIDKYDLPVNYVITESHIIDCNNGGQNGKFE